MTTADVRTAVAAPATHAPRTPRPAGPLSPRPRLRVVPPPRARVTRGPFALLAAGLLAAGLLGLLLLNTALGQGAFRVDALERRAAVLAEKEQALEQEVARQAAPGRLARRASALGMVPSENPAFIRAADGAVLGVPEPGKPAPEPVETRPVPATGGARADGSADNSAVTAR